MITIDNIEYRNLEEQVQKNKEDIAAHYNMDRVLADFGIRIIGRVNTPEDLPDPETFMGAYGDAYAVGEVQDDAAASPFTFYIWTRPDPDAGHEGPYWFNLGELAVVGPQGPAGDPGPRGLPGTRGSLWYSGSAIPTYASNYNIGDIYLRNTGEVYQVVSNGVNKIWTLVANLMGPRGPVGEDGLRGPEGPAGPEGPEGPKGDTGALCRIVGSITSVSQLPTPTQDIRYDGYTQEIGDETHLWIITGDETLQWMDIGAVGGTGGGTKVVVNGVVQDEWNASTVLRNPISSSPGFLYQMNSTGTYTSKVGQQNITTANVDTSVPVLRYINGAVDAARSAAVSAMISTISANGTVPDRTPTSGTDAALRSNQATPRGYVDTLVQHKAEEVIDEVNLTIENALGTFIERPENNPTIANTLLGINTDGTTNLSNLVIESDTYFGNSAIFPLTLEPNAVYVFINPSYKMRLYSTQATTDTTHANRQFALVFSGQNAGTGNPQYAILSKSNSNSWAASNIGLGEVKVDMGSSATKADTISIFKLAIKPQ